MYIGALAELGEQEVPAGEEGGATHTLGPTRRDAEFGIALHKLVDLDVRDGDERRVGVGERWHKVLRECPHSATPSFPNFQASIRDKASEFIPPSPETCRA